MDDLLQRSRVALKEVHGCFLRLERCEPGEEERRAAIEREIEALLDAVDEDCRRLDVLTNKAPPARRRAARLDADQLRYDCGHWRSALRQTARQRQARVEELRVREQLLSGGRFGSNNTAIEIDPSLEAHSRLQGAHSGLDELLGTGSAVLGSLREQRQTLKGAQRKVMDIAHALGLSNTVMRLIEKRAHQDRYVLFGGMFVVCAVMVLVIFYFT